MFETIIIIIGAIVSAIAIGCMIHALVLFISEKIEDIRFKKFLKK